MVVGHLVVGIALGLLAAVTSQFMGCSVLSVLGFFILGSDLGIVLSVVARLLSWQLNDRRFKPFEPAHSASWVQSEVLCEAMRERQVGSPHLGRRFLQGMEGD